MNKERKINILDDASPTMATSGLAMIMGSPVGTLWRRLNNLVRPLLPILHFFMFVVVGIIFFTSIFANWHLPCWYDEICMIDPAWHRVTTGVWRSVAQLDSIDVMPFAPNYPLFINLLRYFLVAFGVNFWILRCAILILALAPVAMLLWLFRSKGLLTSRAGVLQSAYYCACFSFFHWGLYIRPEAVLVPVVTLLVFAWAFNRPVLLFLSSLLVPLCGFQWTALLLPAILHWLVFGGRLRNPLLIAGAFVFSSGATVAAYHALGMWPSYIQEAARVGGLGAFSHFLGALYAIYLQDFGNWIGPLTIPPPVALGLGVLVFGGAFAVLSPINHSTATRKWWLWLILSIASVFGAFGACARMTDHYARPVIAMACLFFPVVFGKIWSRHPLFLFLMVLLPLYPSTLVLWHGIRDGHLTGVGFIRSTPWLDETTLERSLGEVISPSDTICGDASAYFATRALGANVMPLCFAFDMTTSQVRSVTAVLVEDQPVPVRMKDWALPHARGVDWEKGMLQYFPLSSGEDLWTKTVSTDELLTAIATQWHCSFEEIPLPHTAPMPSHYLRYRLFRPVFTNLDLNQPSVG